MRHVSSIEVVCLCGCGYYSLSLFPGEINMGLADTLQREMDSKRATAALRPRVFERPQDVVEFLEGVTQNSPTSVALDMYIALREPFHGSLILWLGGEGVATLTAEQKAVLPTLSFDEKAKKRFRMSLWTKNKRSLDTDDINDIPDGSEIYIERVTVAKLFVASEQTANLAEGNASRVELVTKRGTDSEDTLSKPKDNCSAVEIDNGDTACADGSMQGTSLHADDEDERAAFDVADGDIAGGDDGTLTKANGEDESTADNGDDTAGSVGKIMNVPSKSKAKGMAKKKPRIERD
ncbi:unnamed protein product [Phytophthora fragariaefolia]|uniref:Unnamed protein product n=1 Tax=Phytophthora fragariaefolia TaxID=1490495 RepID=A0A9W6U4Y7_9STRA|nr:unnamed protein product [Phytophthora fragariaefolia]